MGSNQWIKGIWPSWHHLLINFIFSRYSNQLFRVQGGSRKKLYAELLEHRMCSDHLLYLLQRFSTLLYSDNFFSDHMTIKIIKKRNQYIINITANRKNTPATVNSELIYNLSGAKQFRFLYIVIWLKETLFEYRRWHQRDSNPHLLIPKQTSNHLKTLKWRE